MGPAVRERADFDTSMRMLVPVRRIGGRRRFLCPKSFVASGAGSLLALVSRGAFPGDLTTRQDRVRNWYRRNHLIHCVKTDKRLHGHTCRVGLGRTSLKLVLITYPHYELRELRKGCIPAQDGDAEVNAKPLGCIDGRADVRVTGSACGSTRVRR